MSEQKFLITVQHMAVDPTGASSVMSWSAVVDYKSITNNIQFQLAARLVHERALADDPTIRPMTDDEIRGWRNDRQSGRLFWSEKGDPSKDKRKH